MLCCCVGQCLSDPRIYFVCEIVYTQRRRCCQVISTSFSLPNSVSIQNQHTRHLASTPAAELILGSSLIHEHSLTTVCSEHHHSKTTFNNVPNNIQHIISPQALNRPGSHPNSYASEQASPTTPVMTPTHDS